MPISSSLHHTVSQSIVQPVGWITARLSILLFVALLTSVAPATALAQSTDSTTAQRDPDSDQCQTEFRKAEELYFAADFEPAVRLLETCLDEALLNDTTKVQMYRMLAFSYLGGGEADEAERAVEMLLNTAPAYQANPAEDRPDFVELVRTIREERKRLSAEEDKERGWVKWVVGAAGVVALGVLAAVIGSSGGGGDDDIDDFR